MDRNYTGGMLQRARVATRIDEEEHAETVPFSIVKEDLLRSFYEGMTRSSDRRNAVTRSSREIVNALDVPHRCSTCKQYFTINRSYGNHDCFSHYGYADRGKPGGPAWSCCGRPLSSLGCMECEHLPERVNSKGETERKRYRKPEPTMELPLGASLYGAYLPKSKPFYFKRYLNDERLIEDCSGNDGDYLRVKMRYLKQSAYNKLIGSAALSPVRARYFPYVLNRKSKRGELKRSRIYVNFESSKLIVPLYKKR